MASRKPTKEGELKKYKNILQGWGTRYFKLERSYLHYFETKHAPSPIDTVNRGDISQVIRSKQFPNKDNVFEVHSKSGLVWCLQANSEDEMMSWMGSLKPDLYSSPSSQSPQLSHAHQDGVSQRSPLYPSLAAHGLHVSPSSIPSIHHSPGAQYNTAATHPPYNPHLNTPYNTPPSSQHGTYTPPGVAPSTNVPYNTPPRMHYNPTPPGAQYITPPGGPYSTPPGIPYGTTLPAGANNNNTEYSPPPPYQEVPDAPPLPSKGGTS